jgi:hypothetical protein
MLVQLKSLCGPGTSMKNEDEKYEDNFFGSKRRKTNIFIPQLSKEQRKTNLFVFKVSKKRRQTKVFVPQLSKEQRKTVMHLPSAIKGTKKNEFICS